MQPSNDALSATDSPSFISFPRFYLGDPQLRAALDGMEEPVKEQHEMFFDVHPVCSWTLPRGY